MRVLHILKNDPDETVERLIDVLSEDCEASVMPLFNSNVDWLRLVDDIFTHDRVICWW